MNDAIKRNGGESRNRHGVTTSNHSQCGQSLRNLAECSSVKRRQARVTRGERHEQVNNFRASNFAKHDPIRAHAQRLSHQSTHRDLARTFGVGRASAEKNCVRVARRDFRNVFDDKDSLRGCDA
jgi:hypothetical protein